MPLTQLQHQALTGSMLGDGHVRGYCNARFMVSRAVKDQGYLEYERLLFENFLAPRCKDACQFHRSKNKKTGEIKESYVFSTVNSPSLTPYRKLWYPDGIKIVPPNLELSSVAVAHWVADDGSVAFNKLPYRLTLELSTHGFTKTEVEFLADLLNKRYNEEFLVRPKNKRGKRYYIIKAYDSACRALFLDIDPVFKMTRKRIWNKPESRFWNDQPSRQISKVKISNDRKELLRQIIEIGEPITLKQIAEKLSYIHNNKFDHRSVDRVLKPYLDSGKVIKDMDRFNNNTITIRITK